jgi:hypothetical protein
MKLSPGDLCVIIDGSHIEEEHRHFIGRTVVLIEIVPYEEWHYAPFWRCSGIAPSVAVSHTILKRIDPDRMLDARTHLEPTEEEVKCPAFI